MRNKHGSQVVEIGVHQRYVGRYFLQLVQRGDNVWMVNDIFPRSNIVYYQASNFSRRTDWIIFFNDPLPVNRTTV